MKHAWLYTDLLKALKGEPLSSGFSMDGYLIFASAVPHCGGWGGAGGERERERERQRERETETETAIQN